MPQYFIERRDHPHTPWVLSDWLGPLYYFRTAQQAVDYVQGPEPPDQKEQRDGR